VVLYVALWSWKLLYSMVSYEVVLFREMADGFYFRLICLRFPTQLQKSCENLCQGITIYNHITHKTRTHACVIPKKHRERGNVENVWEKVLIE
jgi:hypothetical protein